MSTLRPLDRAKFSPKKLASMSPVKVAAVSMEETMFLNEEDEILVGALVKCIRASGESRKDWEKRIAEIPRSFSDRGLIIEAVNIVFRNEATA